MQSTWAANVFGDHEDPRKRLHVLFGGTMPSGGQPPETALNWALDVLGRDGALTQSVVGSTRLLRRAEPRLTLKAATFLATHATAGARSS